MTQIIYTELERTQWPVKENENGNIIKEKNGIKYIFYRKYG